MPKFDVGLGMQIRMHCGPVVCGLGAACARFSECYTTGDEDMPPTWYVCQVAWRSTGPVVVPRTEGSSDPPKCRGLGQHFDADIANGKTSLPVWPELLYDLCEGARCRFCLLVCFVLLFLLAFLFLVGLVWFGLVWFGWFGWFGWLVCCW